MLGVGFFLQTNFDFLTSHFGRNLFLSFERYCCVKHKFEKYITCVTLFFKSYGGLKIAILANLGQLTHDIVRATNA